MDTEYTGYVFVGRAAGRFQIERGDMTPHTNIFVLSTVSSYKFAAIIYGGHKTALPSASHNLQRNPPVFQQIVGI